MGNFIESRWNKWARLEELTNRASRLLLRGLSGDEVREFGRLYRRTAADLAIAREESQDKRLVNYLNHLVGRAHGAIYRSETSGFGGIADFYKYEFPAVFRKCFGAILLSFSLCLLPAVLGYAVTYMDEPFADRLLPGLRQDVAAHRDWTQEAKQVNGGPLMSSQIQTNNITVTFLAFVGGMTAGILTVVVLIENGLMVGIVLSLCVKHKFWAIPIFMSGHGVIELTAIFISGGAGLLLGKALLMPGDLRRGDALVSNGLLAIKLIMGCIPMLLIAGAIEGLISPSDAPAVLKLVVSGTSALALAAYFMRPDRRKNAESRA